MSLLKTLFPKRNSKRGDDGISIANGGVGKALHLDEAVAEFCSRREQRLTGSQLRLIVVAESERRVLFDSETVLPVNSPGVPSSAPTSACGRFQFLRHRSDVSAIAQMVFGSLSNMKGESFKLHHLSSSRQVMVSRVMSVSKYSKPLNNESKAVVESASSADSESPYSTVRSVEGIRRRNHRSSQTIDPPDGFTRVHNTSVQMDSEEVSSSEPLRPFSPNRLSRNRRLQLSQHGNLCDENNSGRWSCRSRMSSCSSANEEDSKLVAIGIMFREEEKQFVLQHIPLIEIEMLKLETQIAKASLSRTHFLQLLYKAWSELLRNVCLLYNSPRLRYPVWLSLMSEKTHFASANKFCSTLAKLISTYDLKTTAYFVSTLLSSVLMNHLAWVPSVAPPEHCSDVHRSLLLGTSDNLDARRHPYNSQLAQYMEISGSVGGALRLARTVVVGDDMRAVSELLYVLSYFVRCSSLRLDLHTADRWPSPPELKSFSPTGLEKLSEETCATDADLPSGSGMHPRRNGSLAASSSSDSLNSQGEEMMRDEDEEEDDDWQMPLRELMAHSDASLHLGLARSLLAGPCESYCSHFVLSGLPISNININETLSSMIDHVKNGESELICPSSPESSSSSTVSDTAPFSPTVIVLADLKNFTVKVISGDETNVEESRMYSPCDAVVSMLEQFGELYQIGAAPTFLISFLEDALGDVLSKSLSLVEILTSEPFRGASQRKVQNAAEVNQGKKPAGARSNSKVTLPAERVAHIIGCDYSDLRLIVNVAAVYFPPVLQYIA